MDKKTVKPIMLYVAELIYQEVLKIKKKNPEIPNIEAIERFIGTEVYNFIGSGELKGAHSKRRRSRGAPQRRRPGWN